MDRHRPSDMYREEEREGSTCKESTIVADRGGGMYGGEAEHDGCVRASATTSVAYSCTTVAFRETRAKEESLESVKPGFIAGDKKEVSCFFNPLCTRPVQD